MFVISQVIVFTYTHTTHIHTNKPRWLHNLLAEVIIKCSDYGLIIKLLTNFVKCANKRCQCCWRTNKNVKCNFTSIVTFSHDDMSHFCDIALQYNFIPSVVAYKYTLAVWLQSPVSRVKNLHYEIRNWGNLPNVEKLSNNYIFKIYFTPLMYGGLTISISCTQARGSSSHVFAQISTLVATITRKLEICLPSWIQRQPNVLDFSLKSLDHSLSFEAWLAVGINKTWTDIERIAKINSLVRLLQPGHSP
jgi:hypothetical protein